LRRTSRTENVGIEKHGIAMSVKFSPNNGVIARRGRKKKPGGKNYLRKAGCLKENKSARVFVRGKGRLVMQENFEECDKNMEAIEGKERRKCRGGVNFHISQDTRGPGG